MLERVSLLRLRRGSMLAHRTRRSLKIGLKRRRGEKSTGRARSYRPCIFLAQNYRGPKKLGRQKFLGPPNLGRAAKLAAAPPRSPAVPWAFLAPRAPPGRRRISHFKSRIVPYGKRVASHVRKGSKSALRMTEAVALSRPSPGVNSPPRPSHSRDRPAWRSG
jgi:hypothetical protein